MRVMALDGNSLVYRAFFALPDTMANAQGEVTNAVFGFCSMFVTLVNDHHPDAVVVVFDRKEKTFRHEAAPEYKAQREKQPDTLYSQLSLVKDELLPAAGITTLDCAGFEGDDIIATIANSMGSSDELIIVTGDRDAYQLVRDPIVRVLYNKRGVSDYALYDEAGIRERTGVTPAQYADYAALRGDPSDNLDGVPGVGEKTAAKLINSYGSLAGVFAHTDEQTPKLRTSLAESRERVLRNAELMKLRTDVPVPINLLSWTPRPNVAELLGIFARLEFSTMGNRWKAYISRFGGEPSTAGARSTTGSTEQQLVQESSGDLAPISVVVTQGAAADAVALLGQGVPIGMALAWSGAPGRSPVLAVLLTIGEPVVTRGNASTSTKTVAISQEHLRETSLMAALAECETLVVHDARNVMRSLLGLGIDISDLHFDTAIAAYLADSDTGTYDVTTVAQRWLGRSLERSAATVSGQLNFADESDDSLVHDAAVEATVALLSHQALRGALASMHLTDLYLTVEIPLIRVLAKMEHCGIGIDVQHLVRIESELQKRSTVLAATLHTLAGRDFNVNSTQQLAQVLYVDRGVTGGKKTKSKKGYSTDAATLEKIRDEWPEFIDALLEYREVEKLRGTYAQGLLTTVEGDGRIHASFNQTVARTGRLSSDQPNLHNIPIRSESGRVFREVFIPAAGSEFLVADYNQIELRCIAHLAKDPGLLKAFNAGEDIHRATAAKVFGVKPESVTGEQRSKAKMVSYGLAYGMEAYGLSQRLGIDVAEAKTILDAYFTAFPRVKQYMDEAVATAKRDGYTTTLFGRRRRIEGIHSAIRQVEAAATRMAMNAGIQGLAADIFKMALVAIDEQLEAAGMASRLVLQVHDEVVLEVLPAERQAVENLVIGAMLNAASLDVPLLVNAAWGASWAAAKVA